MSIWTHVAGVIRYDAVCALGETHPDLGNTCTFGDDEAAWDKCNVPCGSEGSLVISKWTNPSDTSLAAYTVSIFGDLRDYDDDQEIINYFNRINNSMVTRQAIFTISGGEQDDPRSYIFNHVANKFIKLK